MKSTVFIHTSCHEILAAKVAMYSHIRASKNLDKFDIKLIRLEDYPFILKYHDHRLIRNNKEAAWYKDVPQSFLPLRFLVPQIMGYEGRAVLTDPDIFAIADVYELLTYDMGDKAILSRPRPHRGKLKGYNSSVMLLNCSKLKHWQWESKIDELFAGKLDLKDWISLCTEPEETIGNLEEEWNHYDTLNENTKLLHNTRQITQPWKTGLVYQLEKLDNRLKKTNSQTWFDRLKPFWQQGKKSFLQASKNIFLYGEPCFYRKHPDAQQEELFFCLLKESLEKNYVTPELINAEIKLGHVRPDMFQVLKSVNKSVDELIDSIQQRSEAKIAV